MSLDTAIPSRRSFRTRETEGFQLGLAEEHLDEWGNHIPLKRPTRPRRLHASKTQSHEEDNDDESDDDDDDFTSTDNEELDDDDDDDDIVMTNEEIAESLPTKVIPSNSSGPGKRAKRKGKATSKSGKRARVENGTEGSEEGAIICEPERNSKTEPVRKVTTSNPIHHFYKRVEADSEGNTLKGYKYHRCNLGPRKILQITPSMKNSLNGLIGYLKSTFPHHHRLYELLKKHMDKSPTQEQLDIAAGNIEISAAHIAHFKEKANAIDGNIRHIFEAQMKTKQALWDQTLFEDLIAKWVAACDQPFSVVEEPEFQAVLQYLHRSTDKLHIPGRHAVRHRIDRMADRTHDELKSLFKSNQSKFSVSLDAWTSSNGYAFMAIVVHYISNHGELEECLIDFCELLGQHTGENMASLVWDSLQSYELLGRIIGFVMDNATNNDTLVRSFAARCEAANISFSATDARLRCMPHTVHLAAMKLLSAIGAVSKTETDNGFDAAAVPYQESITAVIGEGDNNAAREDDDDDVTDGEAVKYAVLKLRKLVRHVRSSPQRRKTWQKEVVASTSEATSSELSRVLILDVKTRWSSTHQMLERAIMYKEALKSYAAKDTDLRKFELTPADWLNIEQTANWLLAFREATTQMSSTRKPMLSSVHAIFIGLQKELSTYIASLPPTANIQVRNGLVNAHHKLAEYYTKFDASSYYLWAALLDPRISYESLKKDYANDPHLVKELETAKLALELRFHSEYMHTADTDLAVPLTTQSTSGSKFDFTARYTEDDSGTTQDELADYFRITVKKENFNLCDPIEWWHARRHQFPNLFILARDILSIPGSAVAVERVFSGGRDTISLRRARLQPNTIRTLMLVKARLKVVRAHVEILINDD